jgi:formylmethanofuran dehydrogenase subunit E
VSLIPRDLKPNPRQEALMAKMGKKEASEEEQREFWAIHEQRCRDILETPLENLFNLRGVEIPPPPKARIEPSVNCAQCGEPTMASKLTDKAGKKLCPDCRD